MKLDPVGEIDDILNQYDATRRKSRESDLTDLDGEPERLVTLMLAAIQRWAPPNSGYLRSANQSFELSKGMAHRLIATLPGILQALRDDYNKGRVRSPEELVHADVFGDFLDMSQHLLDNGYKDAAAVIARTTLEEHLRKLCLRHGISTIGLTGQPKKLDGLNSELTAAGAYPKGDQKNVTAWAELRNNAAHGNYGKYTDAQVGLLIQSVRDFLTRIPA